MKRRDRRRPGGHGHNNKEGIEAETPLPDAKERDRPGPRTRSPFVSRRVVRVTTTVIITREESLRVSAGGRDWV